MVLIWTVLLLVSLSFGFPAKVIWASDGKPLEAFETLRKELKEYSPELLKNLRWWF